MGNKIKCEKCGGMFESRGFAMHHNFCKGEAQGERKKIESSESIDKCIECGSKNVVLITEIEKLYPTPEYKKAVAKAINNGYTHLCTDCGEVLK